MKIVWTIIQGKQLVGQKNELSIVINAKKKSQFLRHAFEMEHQQLWHKDFEIIASNYHSSFKRKISEALFVQEKRKINSVTAM